MNFVKHTCKNGTILSIIDLILVVTMSWVKSPLEEHYCLSAKLHYYLSLYGCLIVNNLNQAEKRLGFIVVQMQLHKVFGPIVRF